MIDLNSSPVHSVDEVSSLRKVLEERVRGALEDRANGRPRGEQICVRLSEDVDPIAWIRAQDERESAYWSARNGKETVAAVGAAHVVAGTDDAVDYDALRAEMTPRLDRGSTAMRYYGGLRFDAAAPPPGNEAETGWSEFGSYRFVLPRFELHVQEKGAVLACNLHFPRDAGHESTLVEAIRSISLPTADSRSALPAPTARLDVPDRNGWTHMVRWALDEIGEDTLDKVVLARRVALELGGELDPFLVLHHLKEATPGCFHFAVRPANGGAFIGASPERLFRRSGDRVMSEAVAGTRARGDTAEADAALRDELMESPKERREHAFVQDAIREDLERLCTSVDGPAAPSDLALARGRHLHARLTGTLKSGTSTVDLLDALHPTPAVGGVPTEAALAAIRHQEPFDRGWYAGPVGWMGREEAEFAVAIRSGLVRGSRLALFSGAGIVDGSAPEREWDEIEQKIGDFATILGLARHEEGTS